MASDGDLNFAKTNRRNLQRKQFALLFPVQLMAAALSATNYFVNLLIVSTFVGTAGVAGIGFFSPVNYVVAAVTLTLSAGLQIMSGRFLGKGDFSGIKRTFITSMGACVLIGTVFGLLSLCFPMELAGLLGATGDVKIATAAYLKGFAPNFVLTITGSCLIVCLQMDNARRFAAVAMGMSLFSNALLSVVFLLIFNWGMFGIGLATSFSNLFLNAVALTHIRNSRIFVFSPSQISRSALRDILFFGSYAGICNVLLALRAIFLNHVFFALGGVAAVSAMTVAMCISNTIGGCVECGLYNSTAIIASVLVGERDISGLRRLHKSAATFIFPILAALYLLIFAFAGPIALLFGADPSNFAIYVLCIRICDLWFFTNFFKSPAMAIYNTLGHMKILVVFSLCGFLLFPLLVMGLGLYLGSIAVAASVIWASEAGVYVCAVLYYRVRAGRFPTGFFNICYIPSEFVPLEDVFAYSARTDKEAVEGAVKLMEFCLQHGMNDKLCKICCLCMEEVTTATVSRFPEKKREKYSVEVNGLFEKGHLSLMFHDNLPEFDPRSVLKFYDHRHPEAGVGIRMVVALAKEVQYNFTVGLNSLTVKL